MRPEGEENEAGFEELIMRRICVGTGSPYKKYGKGIVCGESFKEAGISQAAWRNACHAAVSGPASRGAGRGGGRRSSGRQRRRRRRGGRGRGVCRGDPGPGLRSGGARGRGSGSARRRHGAADLPRARAGCWRSLAAPRSLARQLEAAWRVVTAPAGGRRMAALRGDGFARLRPPRAQRTPGRKDKDTPVSNEREPRGPGPRRCVPRTHQVKLRAGAWHPPHPATGKGYSHQTLV